MNKIVKKTKKIIIDFIKEDWGFIVGCIIILVGGIIELPYNIYMGGGIIDIGDRITINDSYDEDGSFNLAYVKMGRANIPVYLMSYVLGWDREPKEEMLIDENDNMDDLWDREQVYLQESIDNAVINAYKLANKEVNIKDNYFSCLYLINKDTDIKVGDRLLKIDGNVITSLDDISTYINTKNAGDTVSVLVKRENNKEVECYVKLMEMNDSVKLGIYFINMIDYDVEPDVRVKFSDKEGGPSGGFMLSLAIYNKLVKEDITHGLKIVGTGTIDVDGNVGEIDGVKYKLKGAVSKKADIFFVCKENLEEALKEKEKHNYKIDVVEVNTLEEAVRYLESR